MEKQQYVIKFIMTATYTAVVKGEFNNEGEALDMARKQMEDADPEEFNIQEEVESQIISSDYI